MCLLSHSQGLLAVWGVKVQGVRRNSNILFVCPLSQGVVRLSGWGGGDGGLTGYGGRGLVLRHRRSGVSPVGGGGGRGFQPDVWSGLFFWLANAMNNLHPM